MPTAFDPSSPSPIRSQFLFARIEAPLRRATALHHANRHIMPPPRLIQTQWGPRESNRLRPFMPRITSFSACRNPGGARRDIFSRCPPEHAAVEKRTRRRQRRRSDYV
ncbi:hypothetical protein SUGI_0051040 [Cryptomeria japonica]|nr:hypothetical protein SUGI_0051040 [Cryptomeria japonica]